MQAEYTAGKSKHLHHKEETIMSMVAMDKCVQIKMTEAIVKDDAGASADLTSHLKTPPQVQKDTPGNKRYYLDALLFRKIQKKSVAITVKAFCTQQIKFYIIYIFFSAPCRI